MKLFVKEGNVFLPLLPVEMQLNTGRWFLWRLTQSTPVSPAGEENGLASLVPLGWGLLLRGAAVPWGVQDHSMVWVGRDLKNHPVLLPCHGQGPHPPAQAAASPVQPGLDVP